MRPPALLTALVLLATAAAPTTPTATAAGSPSASADPLQAYQWNLDRIEAGGAWSRATGSGVVVAVVDSGIDADHPEFAGRLTGGASCIGASTPAGCARQSNAWDDRHGHGTHVAGIVAAPRGNGGVVGVAPEAKLMPVRVLDENAEGRATDVAVGIRYAVANGADVVNLSVGGLPVASQLATQGVLKGELSKAIDEAAAAGVLVVAAAGNDAVPLCNHKVFTSQQGVCVGATDRRDVRSWYSNFGGGLDLVAPGGSSLVLCSEEVLSTDLAGHGTPCGGGANGYEARSGTSMAAPHVAGVGALLAQLGVRGGAAAQRMSATAVDLGTPGGDPVYGRGLVNARRAVTGETGPSWRPAGT